MNLLEELIGRARRYRRFVWTAILLPVAVAAILSLVLPPYYRGQASMLPVNSRLGDKARFTGDEIAELYSAFGGGDDLDRIHATAQSENLFRKLADSFNLVSVYDLQRKGPQAQEAAIKRLRKLTDINRTPDGALRIRAWDRDARRAAAIANAFVSEINRVHQDLHRNFYAATAESLRKSLEAQGDSIDSEIYQRNITGLSLAAQHPPPAVLVVEDAVAAAKPDRPKFWLNVLATFLVSVFVAACGLALFNPSRQSAP
jgi:capsular polysaccharide biosynthesis protein